MRDLLDKYAGKLAAAGLAEADDILFAGLDDEAVWNRESPDRAELSRLFSLLNISALLFARPAGACRVAVDFLASRAGGAVQPDDCETRTFLHDLPVVDAFSAEALAGALGRRKVCIAPGRGVAAFGVVSPEQAFVSFCSACFACFVKFFADGLALARQGRLDEDYRQALRRASALLAPPRPAPPRLAPGPFASAAAARRAMAEAGRATVDYGLVDSFFGNISAFLDETIHISQTGSSLDELEGCIDAVPLDGSTTAGITASSELSAHRDVYLRTKATAILHGHPRFAVILSLDCERQDCPGRGRCHLECATPRSVAGIPIVPGEVGTGPYGLCHTLPPALQSAPAGIVYGHGLFAAGGPDFNGPFATLLGTENRCREEYFARMKALGADLSG